MLITPGGAVGQAADEIAFRNGVAATPDNSTLIIAESFGGRLTAYDILTDGRVSNQRVGRGVQRRDLPPHRGRPLESGLDRRQAPRTAG